MAVEICDFRLDALDVGARLQARRMPPYWMRVLRLQARGTRRLWGRRRRRVSAATGCKLRVAGAAAGAAAAAAACPAGARGAAQATGEAPAAAPLRPPPRPAPRTRAGRLAPQSGACSSYPIGAESCA
jgi:hypothetical protein